MGKTSLKQTGAVPLPNDGPIHFVWQQRHKTTGVDDSVSSDVHDAVAFLRSVATPTSTAESRSPTFRAIDSTSLSCLVHDLWCLNDIREQCQRLRVFRSHVLQARQKQSSDAGVVIATLDTRTAKTSHRVLLEWSLAVATPVPLRRAVHAHLRERTGLSDDATLDIAGAVLDSILSSSSQSTSGPSLWWWKDPIATLQEWIAFMSSDPSLAVDWNETRPRILAFLLTYADTCSMPTLGRFAYTSPSTEMVDQQSQVAIAQAVRVADLFKALLQPGDRNCYWVTQDEPFLERMRDFLWALLSCRAVSEPSLQIIGIAYGRVCVWPYHTNTHTNTSESVDPDALVAKLQKDWSRLPELSDLARAVVVQGLAATLPDQTLFAHRHEDMETPIDMSTLMDTFCDLATGAIDPDVRLAALKGFRTLTSRSLTALVVDNSDSDRLATRNLSFALAQQSLKVVMQAWESPPTRRLANAIPPLFDSVVNLLRRLDQDWSVDALVGRVLSQPAHCKGRYIALEALLPISGAQALVFTASRPANKHSMLDDLLSGIGDHGHNTNAIADLWARILQQYLQELLLQNGIPTLSSSSQSQRTKGAPAVATVMENMETLPSVLTAWCDAWVPSLTEALLVPEVSRRKQIASFCLPRVLKMAGNARPRASLAIVQILQHLNATGQNHSTRLNKPSKERETKKDRVSWAMLEVVRLAAVDQLLREKPVGSTLALDTCVASLISKKCLQSALVHFSPFVRLVAFQAMPHVVKATSSFKDDASRLGHEVFLWKATLPFVVKTSDKEYALTLVQCLLSFMDRLSSWEAKCVLSDDPNAPQSTENSQLQVSSFAIDFLINDVLLQKLTYPGSVVDKECLALSLFEALIVFSCRDLKFAQECRLLPKAGAAFHRKRNFAEEAVCGRIRRALFGFEGLAALFSMLSSNWDGIRDDAYTILNSALALTTRFKLFVPMEFTSNKARSKFEARALFLASSPRQREADAGARILAFLFVSSLTNDQRYDYLERLGSILQERLTLMKVKLQDILSNDTDFVDGAELPLAHGIIRSIRLIYEHHQTLTDTPQNEHDRLGTLFQNMIPMFCKALQLSLGVVADLRDGEAVDGMDRELEFASSKVNPGAIGANGIFSSVQRLSKTEHSRRLASQRIVIGSWLLTKETCAAVSILLSLGCVNPSKESMQQVGMLLISTLTSLKHTGAAFAAHKALQQISVACFSIPNLETLPKEWALRLLDELANSDKIRDSTLRRSTGYGLGFLSIMRSEVACHSANHSLCSFIMKKILCLSLPSKSMLSSFLSSIAWFDRERPIPLPFSLGDEVDGIGLCNQYTLRSRVHALNVLRSILSDAPLAKQVFPAVGDSIVTAMMGYSDTDWSVRNSSTMVFAAVMLRAVDADKNASNEDETSSRAITLAELFRVFPSLPDFLVSVLQASIAGELGEASTSPPVLPILLLLARSQQLSMSGHDSVSIAEPFMQVVFRCLGHAHLSTREAAARAIANLSSAEKKSVTSFHCILQTCNDRLKVNLRTMVWNDLHGTLLCIRDMLALWKLIVKESLGKELLAWLWRFTRVENSQFVVPPLCVSVALEILHRANLTDIESPQLLRACLDIESKLARERHHTRGDTGLSKLGLTAGSIACSVVSEQLWHFSAKCRVQVDESVFSKVETLLRSDCPDVKLASVKVFKKSIYRGLDSMLKSSDAHECSTFLSRLTTTILNALKAELGIGSSKAEKIFIHPPTVRRLSRCLLESFDAYDALAMEVPSTVACSVLCGIGESLLKLGGLEANQNWKLIDVTQLAGNGIELLSRCTLFNDSYEDGFPFQGVIGFLCDHRLPWRLRYSAITAIGTLSTNLTYPPDLCSKWTSASLEYLQDEDPDVRYAASKTLVSPINSNVQIADVALNVLFTGKSNSRIFLPWLERCIEKVLENYSKMNRRVCMLANELTQSGIKSGEILNVGNVREIFEEENPNSYGEHLLFVQLAVRGTLQATVGTVGLNRGIIDKILACCSHMLSQLLLHYTQLPDLDILHDPSRSSDIFPELHAIFLLSATVLTFGVLQESSDIVQKANYFAQHSSVARLQHASRALAQANNSEVSRRQICSCCFLLS
jgi:hypothetical protein